MHKRIALKKFRRSMADLKLPPTARYSVASALQGHTFSIGVRIHNDICFVCALECYLHFVLVMKRVKVFFTRKPVTRINLL